MKKLLVISLAIFSLSAGIDQYLSYCARSRIDAIRFNNAIFAGDSHCSWNIDTADNIGRGGEMLMYTYEKLQTILKNNTGKHLYLCLGYHTFSNSNDKYTYGNLSPDACTPYYFYTSTRNKTTQAIKSLPNIEKLYTALERAIKTEIGGKYRTSSLTGGYFNTPYGIKPTDSTIFDRTATIYGDGINWQQVYYFAKIIALCKETRTSVTVVNTPLHSEHLAQIPTHCIEQYNSVIIASGAKYLNHTRKIVDSLFYQDGDHLTRDGAKQYTAILTKTKNQ